jgi:hypothetical protein
LQRKRKDAIDVNSVLLAWKFLETNENTAYGSQLMAPQLRQMNDIKGVSNLKRNKKAVSNLKRNKKEKRVKERIMTSKTTTTTVPIPLQSSWSGFFEWVSGRVQSE